MADIFDFHKNVLFIWMMSLALEQSRYLDSLHNYKDKCEFNMVDMVAILLGGHLGFPKNCSNFERSLWSWFGIDISTHFRDMSHNMFYM